MIFQPIFYFINLLLLLFDAFSKKRYQFSELYPSPFHRRKAHKNQLKLGF